MLTIQLEQRIIRPARPGWPWGAEYHWQGNMASVVWSRAHCLRGWPRFHCSVCVTYRNNRTWPLVQPWKRTDPFLRTSTLRVFLTPATTVVMNGLTSLSSFAASLLLRPSTWILLNGVSMFSHTLAVLLSESYSFSARMSSICAQRSSFFVFVVFLPILPAFLRSYEGTKFKFCYVNEFVSEWSAFLLVYVHSSRLVFSYVTALTS